MNENKYRRRFATTGCVMAVALLTGTTAVADASPAGAATATQQIIVRPVTTHRHAAPGYRVHIENRSVSCTSTSAAAVDDDIAFCGSSADYTVACWHSSNTRRVLCLPDPRKKTLDSIKLDGTFPEVHAPTHPRPQALRLRNAQTFLVRDGGAGAPLAQHPSWVAAYYRSPRPTTAVYGPKNTPINTRHAAWFVTTYRTSTSRGVRQDVTSAYYVGTES